MDTEMTPRQILIEAKKTMLERELTAEERLLVQQTLLNDLTEVHTLLNTLMDALAELAMEGKLPVNASLAAAVIRITVYKMTDSIIP